MSSMKARSFRPSAGSVDALTRTPAWSRARTLVQVGNLGFVLRLEVVVPQHVEVVLDQLGPLFLDRDSAIRNAGSSLSLSFA